ncbi:MAG: YfbK domain-containing protein [Paracoccaceae bacterium]
MTDDLEKLAAALRAAPPAPDPAAREAALARAMENFDRQISGAGQESAQALRPSQDRQQRAGFLTGVMQMLEKLTSRPALAATASLAIVGVGVLIALPMQPQLTDNTPALPQPEVDTVAGPAQPVAPAGANDLTSSVAVAAETNVPTATQPDVAGEVANAPVLAEESANARARIDQPPEGFVSKTADAAPAETATGGDAVAQMMPEAEAPLAEPAIELGRAETAAVASAETDMAEAPPAPSPAAPMEDARARHITDGEVMRIAAPSDPIVAVPEPNTEAFPDEPQNPVKITAQDPVSTFSIDVDTAGYSYVRSSLMNGTLPPPEAVRVEEMVNYFPYAYPTPQAGEAPFRPTVTVIPAPWSEDRRLVHIGIQGELPAVADRPALNLVFLIDTSGSMDEPNKLPLLKQSFRLMVGQLRPEDRVAIVTYAGSAGLVLESTPASDSAKILAALDMLDAGGSTAGQEGLQQAYAVAAGMAEDGEVTRVVLATDGDFNVGISDPEELETFIAKKRDSGTYLSVLGFGRGNLDDATMQALAQNGNGQAAYIDTLSEAQKVLVDQLTGALFPIANDVKIQVEWNPATVAEYRLIGYETRALAREDFNNDKVDAGEIGAGHTVTAIYEVTPVGSPARMTDPSRYATAEAALPPGDVANELGFLKLRWKEPGATDSTLMETPITPESGTVNDDIRFAVAMAGMGQLLTDAKYLGEWGWDQAIDLANGAKGADDFGYRAEAVQLMRLAQSLSK